MSQAVTYADLRFVRGPPETKRSPPTEPEDEGDAELTYENVRGGPPPRQGQEEEEEAAAAAASRGCSRCAAGLGPWTWPPALTLLATCLFLLAGTIGVGIRYWQVSWQLQQASQGHSAERDALAERISTREGQLDEARAELSSTRLTLQDCKTARNRTQERLQELERELSFAKRRLALLQEEKNRTEEELHRARSCQQRGCCPLGWEHFQQKCLWISWHKKTWEKSEEDCEGKASHLVVLKRPQEAGEMWDALFRKGTESALPFYEAWIGLKETHEMVLFWVDGSCYDRTKKPSNYNAGYCIKIRNRELSFDDCYTNRQYICEKAASPALPAQAPGQ